MEKFTNDELLTAHFIEESEKEFTLLGMGYHDLSRVAPLKATRIQPFYTLHFILAGGGTLNIYGNRYTLSEGQLFFIPPNTPMNYYADPANPWQYVWVEFTGEKAAAYGEKLTGSPTEPRVHCHRPHEAYRVIWDTFTHLSRGEKVGYYAALSLFYHLMDTCTEAKSDGETLATKAAHYILCHYHNPDLRTEDICRDLKVSHSQLSTKFRRQHGCSLKEYILTVRINEARRLLAETRLRIGEVGFSVGFADGLHFMKTFKRLTGQTAGEYRRLAGGHPTP